MASFLVMTSMKWEIMNIKSIFKHFLNRDGDKNKPGSSDRKIANFLFMACCETLKMESETAPEI